MPQASRPDCGCFSTRRGGPIIVAITVVPLERCPWIVEARKVTLYRDEEPELNRGRV